MSSFTIEDPTPPIKVSLCEGITKDELLSHKPFSQWLTTLRQSLKTQSNPAHAFHKTPYVLKSTQIQAVDRFGGGRIGFLKTQAVIENSKGERLSGANFMRGGSVAMLILLEPDDGSEKLYTIMTIQPRPAVGSLAFAEIPAGMIDDSGTFSGAAAKELQEETGLTFKEDELVDLSALTASLTSTPTSSGENLQKAVYPSPGACDEFIPIFLGRKKVSRRQLEEMQGKLTGLRAQGEKITLKIVKARDLWKEGFRDGKSLAAWALYCGLKEEGRI